MRVRLPVLVRGGLPETARRRCRGARAIGASQRPPSFGRDTYAQGSTPCGGCAGGCGHVIERCAGMQDKSARRFGSCAAGAYLEPQSMSCMQRRFERDLQRRDGECAELITGAARAYFIADPFGEVTSPSRSAERVPMQERRHAYLKGEEHASRVWYPRCQYQCSVRRRRLRCCRPQPYLATATRQNFASQGSIWLHPP